MSFHVFQTQLLPRPRQQECETRHTPSSATKSPVVQRKRPRSVPGPPWNTLAGRGQTSCPSRRKEPSGDARYVHLTACMVHRPEFSINRDIYESSGQEGQVPVSKLEEGSRNWKTLSATKAGAQTTPEISFPGRSGWDRAAPGTLRHSADAAQAASPGPWQAVTCGLPCPRGVPKSGTGESAKRRPRPATSCCLKL